MMTLHEPVARYHRPVAPTLRMITGTEPPGYLARPARPYYSGSREVAMNSMQALIAAHEQASCLRLFKWNLLPVWTADQAVHLIALGGLVDLEAELSDDVSDPPAATMAGAVGVLSTHANAAIASGDLKDPDTPEAWMAWAESLDLDVSHLRRHIKARGQPGGAIKRSALIDKYRGLWQTVEEDLRRASENGLSAAARTTGKGYWNEGGAVEWAASRGKIKSSPPLRGSKFPGG